MSEVRLTLAIALSILTGVAGAARAQGAVEGGRNIAHQLCGTCHALESAERSPLPMAPAFRHIEPASTWTN